MSLQPADDPNATRRDHALDALRGFAMFLGILIHGSMSFMSRTLFWPARDVRRSELADVFILAVHAFRMQLFFLLAGFFAAMLHCRRGLRGLLQNRAKRIGLPLVAALLLVLPSVHALLVHGEVAEHHAIRLDPSLREPVRYYIFPAYVDFPGTPIQAVSDHFTTGAFLATTMPMHLWFLYYLLLCYALMVPTLAIARALAGTRVARSVESAYGLLVTLPGRSLALAIPTAALLMTMQLWMVDTPEGWTPRWNILGYYFGFFAFGWMLQHHREGLVSLGRHWGGSLATAVFVLLPTVLILIVMGLPQELTSGPPRWPSPAWWRKVACLYAASIYTWLMIGGLLGAAARLMSRERPWVRYLSDASYWCYLMSITPLLFLQLVLAPVEMPGLLKFAIINGLTLAMLLVTYHAFVRSTWVGLMLNGRRHGRPSEPAPARAVAAGSHA